jgi:hypothetical protein
MFSHGTLHPATKFREEPQEAMEYLSFSKGTFDKYRYSSQIKIKGYQLDGKTWFKKSDLDRFMLTYQAKSVGLA